MSTKIVTELLNFNPPRRFLEKSETGKWQEVPLKRAVTKTSQALRDVARDRAKAAGAVAATKSSTVSSFHQTTNNASNNNESELASSSLTPAAAAMPSYHPPAPNLYPLAVNNKMIILSSSKMFFHWRDCNKMLVIFLLSMPLDLSEEQILPSTCFWKN